MESEILELVLAKVILGKVIRNLTHQQLALVGENIDTEAQDVTVIDRVA